MPQKQVIPFVLSGANKAWRVLKRIVLTTYARIANFEGSAQTFDSGITVNTGSNLYLSNG